MPFPIKTFDSAPFEIIDGDRGKAYPKQSEFQSSGHCLFLSATNVTKAGFDFASGQFIDEQKDTQMRKGKLQREDIVLTTRGTLGNAAYYNANVPFEHVRINSGMVILRCDQLKILPRYLYAYLRSEMFHGQVERIRSGVAQPQLPIRDMKRIKVPVPPPSLQERIVEIVGAYDDLIENNRRRIALLEEAARLLYREWFIHFRFPGHEQAKTIDGLPEGWERRSLGDFVRIRKGKNITKETVEKGDVPVIAGGLRPAYFHSTPNAIGPVVTVSASGANAGYVGLYHENIWASDCSYLSITDNPEIWFIYLSMKSQQVVITGMQQGAAQPHVYPKHLERLDLMIAPAPIRALFHERVEANFLQMANLEKQNQKLAQARDLLLPRLMSGEIAV